MFDVLKDPTVSPEELEEKLKELRLATMGDAHPSIDMFTFFGGEFGRRFAAHKVQGSKFQADPMCAEVLDYYHRLGLKKEMYETEDFYTRWTIITPEKPEEGKKYPLVIFAHGAFGPLEGSEFCGFAEFQAEEGFMAVYPQNTNAEFIAHIIDEVEKRYPLDTERVYMGGYSAGGSKTIEAFVKIPERLAACGPCAGSFTDWSEDITKPAPRDIPYVPTIRVDSEFDPSRFIPLNRWVKRITMLDWFGLPRPKSNKPMPKGWDPDKDPTFGMVPDGKGGFVSSKIKPGPVILPPQGISFDEWRVCQFNYRLDSLHCKKMDLARCMSFAVHPEDRIHHLFGAYGEEEHVEEHYCVKHYVMNYFNDEGINAMRFIAIENAPHNPTPALPRLLWDYFKKFRRDSKTGKIVQES